VSVPLYHTFAYVHPDLAEHPEGAGLRVARNGSLAMVETDDSVRQAILLLLTTIPGERVMRPDYGCELHRLTFAPNDDTTAGLAIHYVRRALDLFEPRIDVVRLDASANPDDPGRLDVTLEYRVKRTQLPGSLDMSISLAGEQP
jgi:phage baseplate assembly protein W